MAYASDNPKNVNKKLSEKLNCPICLEVFKSPRALSCLHTFCEKCINSYIVSAIEKGSLKSVIQCPTCTAETVPPSPSKPPSEWSKELPLNFAILPLLESMESERRVFCDNCNEFDRKIPAISYCKNCKQCQCEDCVASHTRFASMKGHQIVYIDSISEVMREPFSLGKMEYCLQHADKLVELYCEDDKKFCCTVCAFLHHRACKQVKEVRELGQHLKESDRPKQLQEQMGILQTRLGALNENFVRNISDIEKQTEEMPQKMTQIRNKVMKILDHLVRQVTSECGHLKKQYTTEIQDKITSIRCLEATINSSRSLLECLLKQGTPTQIFIAINKLEEQVTQYQTQVREAEMSTTTVKLGLNVSKNLDKILQSTNDLAKVSSKITFNIHQREKLEQPEYFGVDYLPDGRLVAVDRRNNLCCLLDDSCKVTADVKLPSWPTDLAVIGPTEVIVALPWSRQLQLVSIETTLTLTRSIQCSRIPRCVSCISDTELAVGWRTGIGIISLDGKEKSYVDKDKLGRDITFYDYRSCIVAETRGSRTYMYYSCLKDNTVYCLGFAGEIHFTYNKNLSCPCAMALNRDRNLYICCLGSKNVHQVCPTGQLVQVIDPDIGSPRTVCFNQAGDQMLVLNDVTNKGQKIKFSSLKK